MIKCLRILIDCSQLSKTSPPEIIMHDAYIGGHSENNIKCVVVHNDLGRKNQITRYNCRFSAASLALQVIFSVSLLWNIFGSFTEQFNCRNMTLALKNFCDRGIGVDCWVVVNDTCNDQDEADEMTAEVKQLMSYYNNIVSFLVVVIACVCY